MDETPQKENFKFHGIFGHSKIDKEKNYAKKQRQNRGKAEKEFYCIRGPGIGINSINEFIIIQYAGKVELHGCNCHSNLCDEVHEEK